MKKNINMQTVLIGIVIILLAILILKEPTQYVNAQGDGFAKHVFGLIGDRQGNREPLYLIDTQEQTILVYEYATQGEGLGLVSARSYKHDKQLEKFGRAYGPSIKKIKDILLKTK